MINNETLSIGFNSVGFDEDWVSLCVGDGSLSTDAFDEWAGTCPCADWCGSQEIAPPLAA
jgi:hypothetical protein